MKPGWQTSEFWMNMIVTGYMAMQTILPPQEAAMLIAASNGLYMLSRTVVKIGDAVKAKKKG